MQDTAKMLRDTRYTPTQTRTQMLLRGATLRNTKWVMGLVVYTGSESKLVLNSRKAPSKLSTIEAQVNTTLGIIFFGYFVLTMAMTIIRSARQYDLWYINHVYSGIIATLPALTILPSFYPYAFNVARE